MRIHKGLTWTFLMTAALLAGGGYEKAADKRAQEKPPAPSVESPGKNGRASDSKLPTPVRVKAVESYSSGTGVHYSANIRPSKQVELAFKVGGYIGALHQVRGIDGRMRDVQEGDFIPKGTVLARVQESDYTTRINQARSQQEEARKTLDATQAQVVEAEAAYERARRDFERADKLFQSQSLTRADHDAAKAQLDIAGARAAAAKAQIPVVQARIGGAEARLAEASIALHDTALRAPMDCVVLQRAVEVGTLVSAGRPGFVVADTRTVKVGFGVPDLAVQSLKLGHLLTVRAEAVPGTEFRGQISAISPAADFKSRVFEVEVTIPNPRNQLKIGMIASLTVAESGAPRQQAVVPLSAVVRSKEQPGAYAVFVVENRNGKQYARPRTVRLGEAFGNTISVLEGLKVGDPVIVTGATLVVAGEPIQVIP